MGTKRTKSKAASDPFSAHEALDRAHLIASIFSDFVADHDFIQAHPKLREHADELAVQLGAFYQAVGNVTFNEGMSPVVLAKELGVDGKTLRQFLREHFPRDPILNGSRWWLTVEHVLAARKRWSD